MSLLPAVRTAFLTTRTDNTLNVTAAIFEMISEVNGKFAKIADKECDNLNDDVKKWFRKLAVSSVHSFLALDN